MLLLGVSFYGLAQNLFQNPGFETYTSCPTGLGQTNRATPYFSYNTASPDYFNCAYNGNSAIRGTPKSGTGVMGVWGQANSTAHSLCPSINSGYAEYVTGPMGTPLVSGNTYTVSIDIMIDGIGTSTRAPDNCFDFGFYFYQTGSAPPFTAYCVLNVAPQVSFNSSALLQGTYQNFTFPFTAAGNYDNVIIGPYLNAMTPTCPTATSRMYYNYDDISIVASASLSTTLLNFSGLKNEEVNEVYWDIILGEEDDLLTLESSPEGISFVPIAEYQVSASKAGQTASYSFTDTEPHEGATYYRLRRRTKNGDNVFYKTIRVMGGMLSEFEILSVYPNPAAEMVYLKLFVPTSGEGQIQVRNSLGQLVHKDVGYLNAGVNQLPIRSETFPKGLYFVSIQNDEGLLRSEQFLRK